MMMVLVAVLVMVFVLFGDVNDGGRVGDGVCFVW